MKIRDILESDFGYLLENFNKDKQYNGSKDVYSNFEIFINTEHVNNAEECKNKLNDEFFHMCENLRIGNERTCSNVNYLVGHVVNTKQLISELPFIYQERGTAEVLNLDLFEWSEKLSTGSVTRETFADMDGYRMRRYQMWCFLNGNSVNSLLGDNPNNLPFKLALYETENDGEQFLFFAIRKPSNIRAYKPTFFDAGFGEYWRPGGSTCPIGKCSGENGLEEIIIERLYHGDNVMSVESLIIQN